MTIRTESANERLDRLRMQKARIEALDPNRQLKTAFELAMGRLERGGQVGGKRVYTVNEILEKNQRELRAWGKLAPRLDKINADIQFLEKAIASGIPLVPVQSGVVHPPITANVYGQKAAERPSVILEKIIGEVKDETPIGENCFQEVQRLAKAIHDLIITHGVESGERSTLHRLYEAIYDLKGADSRGDLFIISKLKEGLDDLKAIEKEEPKTPTVFEKPSEILQRIITNAETNLSKPEPTGLGRDGWREFRDLAFEIYCMALDSPMPIEKKRRLEFVYDTATPRRVNSTHFYEDEIQQLKKALEVVVEMETGVKPTEKKEAPPKLEEMKIDLLDDSNLITSMKTLVNYANANLQQEKPEGLGDLAPSLKEALRDIESLVENAGLSTDERAAVFRELSWFRDTFIDKDYVLTLPEVEALTRLVPMVKEMEKRIAEKEKLESPTMAEKASETLERLINSATANLQLAESERKGIGEEGVKELNALVGKIQELEKTVVVPPWAQSVLTDAYDWLSKFQPNKYINENGIKSLEQLLYVVKQMENPAPPKPEKPSAALSDEVMAKLARAETIIETAKSEGILGLDLNEVKDLLRLIKNTEADTSLNLSDFEKTHLATLRGALQNIVDEMEKVTAPEQVKEKNEGIPAQDKPEEKPEELLMREKPSRRENISELLSEMIQKLDDARKTGISVFQDEARKVKSLLEDALAMGEETGLSEKDKRRLSEALSSFTDCGLAFIPSKSQLNALKDALKTVKSVEKQFEKKKKREQKEPEKVTKTGREEKRERGEPEITEKPDETVQKVGKPKRAWLKYTIIGVAAAAIGAGIYLGIIRPKDKKIDQLNDQVKQEQKMNDDLTAKYEAYADSIGILNRSIVEKDSTIAAQDSINAEQEKTIKVLNKRIHKLEMEKYKAKSLAKELAEMYQYVRDELVKCQDAGYGADNAKVIELNKKKAELETQINELKKQLETTEDALQKARMTVENMTVTVKTLDFSK
ncbi:MAG: hypothetical protein AB1468_01740 [Candidatus Micrarchaeota archaeon]